MNIIQDRLKSYKATSKQEELGALKEIYQEIALAGLARGNFFKEGAFQGRTALQIVHQLQRFSEDLDFVLLQPSKSFQWHPFLEAIDFEFRSFGVNLELKERETATGNIKTPFLKEDSFAKILELTYRRLPSDEQKITIKLEIDTNPPEGSTYNTEYLPYPYPFSILVQDLPSLFATKCHALLCRKYDKGRDWFDLLWYLNRRTSVNTELLKNALAQSGPYAGQSIPFSQEWLSGELKKKIHNLDWKKAKLDILNFLKPQDRQFVANWNADFFEKQMDTIDTP